MAQFIPVYTDPLGGAECWTASSDATEWRWELSRFDGSKVAFGSGGTAAPGFDFGSQGYLGSGHEFFGQISASVAEGFAADRAFNVSLLVDDERLVDNLVIAQALPLLADEARRLPADLPDAYVRCSAPTDHVTYCGPDGPIVVTFGDPPLG